MLANDKLKETYFFNGQLHEIELAVDPKSKLYIRPKTSDHQMIREAVKKDYRTINCKGKVCLDLGGNVGGFALKAAREGAVKVVSYEPEPSNFRMLQLNFARIREMHPNTELAAIEEAVSGNEGSFDLVLNPGGNAHCSASLVRKSRKGSLSIKVKVVALRDVVAALKPDMIKMDVEGAEYDMLPEAIDPCVKEIAIELHGFTIEHRAKMAGQLAELKAQGWNVVEEQTKVIFNETSLITAHLTR